jgi:dynein heavy chain
MNQIIMEETMAKPEEERREMIPANLTLPPKPMAREVPYFGQVPIPPHDFPEQFSTFCFNSLFIKDEVIRAMVQIREECNCVLRDNHIFNVQLNKLYRLEEFKQQQNSSISTMKFNTCEQGWVSRLEKIIKSSFKDVGKGWFNINESSKPTYEFGKLKKFLTLVNFMMQDTVLNMCKNSVHEFVEFMLNFIPDETLISSAAVVTNKYHRFEGLDLNAEDDSIPVREDDLDGVKETKGWVNKKFAKDSNPDPLFQLDLILKGKNLIPQYSNPPKDIVIKIKEVFEEGIRCLQEIPHLEPMLLRHLFKTHVAKTIKTPVIPPEKPKAPDPNNKKALVDENTWLWEAFDKLIQNLERAIIPLDEYVKTYSAFELENQLDPDKHVAELDDGDTPISPEELRLDIERHKEKEQRLLEKIPEFVYVSMFQVNCKDIRNGYAQKYQLIVEKEIKLISYKAKDKNYELTSQFGHMEEKIKKPPTNIDELTDLKNFIKDCGPDIEKKKKEIDDCMGIYKILDDFNFESSQVDLNAKWDLFGAPQRLVKLMEERTVELDKLKEQMIKEMEMDQEDFEDMLDNLELTVGGFDANKRLEKYLDIAAEA